MGLEPIGAILILAIFLGPFVLCWYATLRGLLKRAVGIGPFDPAEIHNWSLLGSVIVLLLMLNAAWCGIGVFIANLTLICTTCVVALLLASRKQPVPTEAGARAKRAFIQYLLFTAAIGIAAGYLAEQFLARTLVDD